MKRWEMFMLEAMLFSLLAVAYYIPLSLLVDGRFLIGGFAFALFWCKEYYERLVQEGYWEERIASRIWLTSTLILVPVLPIIYGLVLGFILGWDATWKGAVIGGAIAFGSLVFDTVEWLYLRVTAARRSNTDNAMRTD